MAFKACEEMNGLVVHLRAELRTQPSQPHFVWIAEAYENIAQIGVARPWASASVSMLTRGDGGTDVALLLLAYELDRDIFRRQSGISKVK